MDALVSIHFMEQIMYASGLLSRKKVYLHHVHSQPIYITWQGNWSRERVTLHD